MPLPNRSDPAVSHDTVERILRAAEKLFAEQGFDAVSMNAIAVAASICKANVFHHFNSKQALYLAVLQNACRNATQHLDALDQPGIPLAERLAQFTRAHLEDLLNQDRLTRLMLRELLGGNPRTAQDLAEKVYGEKFSRFVTILRDGQDSGELRADIDPAMVATVLLGANVFFFESREVLRHFPEASFARHPGQFSQMLTDILLRGILPAPT